MTRRLSIDWPDPRPFAGREGRPIRILAASDEPDPALERAANRDALGSIDLVVGCGDLSPDWLCFLGDAFRAPLVYVRGNHDRQAARGRRPTAAAARRRRGRSCARRHPGGRAAMAQLPQGRGAARREGCLAAGHAARAGPRTAPAAAGPRGQPRPAARRRRHPDRRVPRGLRRVPGHRTSLRPPLWLHGHTNPAAQADWRTTLGTTTVVNVTGSVLVELRRPGGAPG